MYLRGRALLLVLDNFEQVIEAARAVAELLSGAPGCGVIVTSRERLGVAAEQEYPVAPLSPHAAVELFTARARQVEPGYEPARVDAICERLDRLPLALELAATRVKLLSEQQLLTRLSGGSRSSPAGARPPHAAQHDAGDDRLELRPAERGRAAVVHPAGGVRRQLRARCGGTDLRRRSRRHAVTDRQELVRHADNGWLFLLHYAQYALEQSTQATSATSSAPATHAGTSRSVSLR